jgi:Kef-type K+ transport system membrane component KefB
MDCEIRRKTIGEHSNRFSSEIGDMAANDRSIEILKTHKRWADVYSHISIVLVVGLLSATALLADAANTDMATRVGMFVTTTAVVIVVSIWQAAGLTVACVHKIILDQRDE